MKRPGSSASSAWNARMAAIHRSAGCIRPHCALSARPRTCSDLCRRGCRIPRHGLIMASGASAIRWARVAVPARGASLRLPARRGREPASDPGRACACRHHRAGAFSIYRERRNGCSAGGAPRICAQGHRGPDGGVAPSIAAAKLAGRTSGDSTVAYSFAFARAVEAALERRGSAARGLAARTHGRAGASRQPSRRHRRHLQRRRLRAHACPLRRAARACVARGRCGLRPPSDARPHRAGRDRKRPER